jgi:hypothetical protein
MEQADVLEVEKAINGLKLPKDCKWFKPGFGFTCKAKDIGLDSYVECLEKDSFRCPFSVSYAYSYYCIFPARVYVAKALKK